MCGIAGIFLRKKKRQWIEDEQAKIAKILLDQATRGPDFKRIETIESPHNLVLFGHNRLSIVDLAESSHQPMWDETGRYCLIYNGMLYNYVELRKKLIVMGYRFFSQGDTEVILKSFIAFGRDSFNLFNGMFALAIYDKVAERLYLARDRFGVKPLFYTIVENKLYFASSSKELARQLTLQPNFAMLARGINYWCFDGGNETVYENLTMVAPSELLIFEFTPSLQKVSAHYFNLALQVKNTAASMIFDNVDRVIEEAECLLQDATRIRLQSDVPLGISLSGGIDSGTVAGMAKKELGELKAFSFGCLHNHHTEAKRSQLTANHLGVDIQFIYPAAQEMQAGFWQTLSLQDAPFPNFSIVGQYFVFNEAHRQGIKVMLGGQGGDEIFMGYQKYFYFYLQRLLFEKKFLRAMCCGASLLPSLITQANQLTSHWFNIKRYTAKTFHSRWQNPAQKMFVGSDKEEALWRRQLRDIDALSLPTLLRYEDRNSMGNSIESRLPFLDYRLVKFALALPDAFKLRHGFSKWILRKISANYIPREIYRARTKRGFDVDTRHWIHAGVGESMRLQLKANPAMLKQLGLQHSIDNIFNDAQLITNRAALAECITLAWLASKRHFIWS